MADSLAAIVLAAGGGTRLQPLTWLRPKALCPVGGVALVDRAVGQARSVTDAVAVNVHHGREQLERHLAGRVHLSVEEDRALGTAGALGRLKPWIDGRPVLVVNADACHDADLADLVAGWDGERIRLLTVETAGRADWGRRLYAGACLMPWAEVAPLKAEPSGLYEVSWSRDGSRLDLVDHPGPYFDCGTPARYLAANLWVSGGASVVGEGVVVEGHLDSCVVWPGARVARGERLHRAVRADDGITVLVR